MYRSLPLAILFLAGLISPVAAQKPRTPAATPAESLKVKKDFKVELLYSVPRDKHGSWVNLCVDPRGRLITSDQYGPLYRITPPAPGAPASDTKVEKIPVPLGDAQGLLWAFDSLYVVVNSNRMPSGLYRVRDTDGDDVLDKVEHLRKFEGMNREHGPHAVLLSPDGKSLTVVCGNQEPVTQLARSRVPRIWGEDHILPRMPDGNGFMKGVLAPGGCIYKVDLDGKDWELVSNGFRNEFDAAYNRQGELFTYDADMEWDINTPWYRPTRVCLVTSGSEFGWRNGAGKWPAYYPDSLPSIVDVGPGSPTGVCFGYHARFPAKYQDAFYMCDWSYGKLYAVHLTPEGSAYKGEMEEFVTGTPLPLTDVVVNRKDGMMYFTIGGRKTQSGLYRVSYVGKESTQPAKDDNRGADLRGLRHKIESYHKPDGRAVEEVWPYLKHEDRYIRFAARVALEHQDPKAFAERALKESQSPQALLTSLLALVRVSAADPFHRKPGSRQPDAELKGRILAALERLGWSTLSDTQRMEMLRIYEVLFNRMGPPEGEARKRVIARLDGVYPSKVREQNAELCQLLVYLEAPSVVTKTLKLLAEAPTQEEQMEYARALRVLKTGWTLPQRREYFAWFQKAHGYKGGNSFRGFLRLMIDDALANVDEKEKTEVLKLLLQTPTTGVVNPVTSKPRPFVKKWTLDEVTGVLETGLKKKRDFDRGRVLFGEANCFSCHRFDNEGGSQGPDLTGVAGRFNVRDLAESIVEPSKVISDQYAAVNIVTTDGKTVTGRIVNLSGDTIIVMPNMLDPNGLVHVDARKVESIETSKVSPMPDGLLDTFKEDEIADLVAYLLSGGNRKHKLFQ